MDEIFFERINNIVNSKPSDSELLSQLKRIVYELEIQNYVLRDSKGISELFNENMRILLKDNADPNTIKSGFTDLDNAIGGFSPGELVVIGGRPGMGKSQFLINLALNISVSIPVQYFTFDLTSSSLTARFMATLSGIEVRKIRQNILNEEEKQKLAILEGEMASRKLFINESCSNSVTALKMHCLQQISEHGVKVIIVDYIQMMSSNRYRNNRELEVSYIIRELKNFAKDNDVCIIAGSQLSRGVETRPMSSKRPQLSDLRESGSIEQDADKVIFIYRPEYYMISEDEDGNSTDGMTLLIIAKNRSGAVDDVWIKRNNNFTSFNNFEGFRNDFAFLPSRLNEIDLPPF